MNMEQLKTFEDACKIEGLDPEKVLPDFSNYPEKDQKSMLAHAKLIIIIRAANRIDNDNQEWVPDFDNPDQWKYEIWFQKGSSGFRFGDYDYWYSHSLVGSRLCFKSRKTAEYIVNQFEDLYNEYLL